MKTRVTKTLSLILILLNLSAISASAAKVAIKIPLTRGSEVTASVEGQGSFNLGKILQAPGKSRWPSYTASAWADRGTVCASAVNALHILLETQEGRGRTISILPSVTIAPAAGESSFFSIESKAGFGLFGAFAPPVGAAVFIGRTGSDCLLPLKNWPLEKNWDYLVIKYSTQSTGFVVDIENRPGGRVISWEKDKPELLARVIRPVGGVGRFGGTKFQNRSRIRANHPGVIDVSTSGYGEIGGFQIIPLFHAFSKEMVSAWELTQWMIITGPDGNTNLNGKAPLFSGNLVPGTQKGEALWDLWSTYGRKSLILARIDGGKWEQLPMGTGRKDNALEGITHIRIYFPFDREPQL